MYLGISLGNQRSAVPRILKGKTGTRINSKVCLAVQEASVEEHILRRRTTYFAREWATCIVIHTVRKRSYWIRFAHPGFRCYLATVTL